MGLTWYNVFPFKIFLETYVKESSLVIWAFKRKSQTYFTREGILKPVYQGLKYSLHVYYCYELSRALWGLGRIYIK